MESPDIIAACDSDKRLLMVPTTWKLEAWPAVYIAITSHMIMFVGRRIVANAANANALHILFRSLVTDPQVLGHGRGHTACVAFQEISLEAHQRASDEVL